jgi:MFS family permease
LPTPLLPFIRNDFNLDYTQSALVISAFTLAYGIGQLPAGWLADRIGPRILITVGICGVALTGIMVGLSQTYILMIVFLVLMGLAAGGYHPAAAPLISTSVEPEKRGRALGFHLIGGSGSYFLSPIIAAAIAAAWGWRSSFIGLAVPAAAFGIVFYIYLGRRARASQTQNGGVGQPVVTSSKAGDSRRLVVFMILSVLTAGVGMSTITFIPLYLVDHFGVNEQTAASMLAITFSAGLWASPLGGYLTDRLGKIPLILATCFLAGFVIYFLKMAPYSLGIGAILLVLGMFTYVRMPLSEAYIIEKTPARHRSTVYGIYYCAMQESGTVLLPVMGWLIDSYGFHSSFTMASVAIIAVTLICSVFFWRSRG